MATHEAIHERCFLQNVLHIDRSGLAGGEPILELIDCRSQIRFEIVDIVLRPRLVNALVHQGDVETVTERVSAPFDSLKYGTDLTVSDAGGPPLSLCGDADYGERAQDKS